MSSHHRRASSVVSVAGSRPGSRMDDKPKLALSHILVHRCEFKMPKNQKYSCPRNGEMFDPLFAVWYCQIHDRDAQRRCQAFSDYQGIRCPELGERINKETDRRYCVKHFKDENSHIEEPGVHRIPVVARAQTPVSKPFERKQTGRETPTLRKREERKEGVIMRRMSDAAVPVAPKPVVHRTKRLSVGSIPPAAMPPRRVRDTPTPTRTYTPLHRRHTSEPPKPKPTPKPQPAPVKLIPKPQPAPVKIVPKPQPAPVKIIPKPQPAPPKKMPQIQPAPPRAFKRKPRISNLAASIDKPTLPVPKVISAAIQPASPIPIPATSEPPAPKPLTPEPVDPESLVLALAASLSLPPSPPPPPPIEEVVIIRPISPHLDPPVLPEPPLVPSRSPSPPPSPLPSPPPPIAEAVLISPISPSQPRWTSPPSQLPSPMHFEVDEDVLQKARNRLSSFRSPTPTTPSSPPQDRYYPKDSSPLPSPAFLHSPPISPTKEDVLTKARARLSSFQYPALPPSPSPDRWASASPSPRWASTNITPLQSPFLPQSPAEETSPRGVHRRLNSFQYPQPSPTPPPLPPSPYEPSVRTFQPRPRPSPLQFPSLTPTTPAIDDPPKKPPNRLPAFSFPASPSTPAPRSPSTPVLTNTPNRLHHPSIRSISHVMSRFLHMTEHREEEEKNKIAAMYQECNICFEKHNANMMKQVQDCGHQYRELCLQKVLRNGTSRVYNCSSCRTWMGKLLKEREDFNNKGNGGHNDRPGGHDDRIGTPAPIN